MGELARKKGCPELAASPLELLTPRTDHGFMIDTKYLWPLFGVVAGIATTKYTNFLFSRPPWASIHYHILVAGMTAYLMTLLRDKKKATKAEADDIYRHYVSIHPDDFPPYERKRYRDVYEPFHPLR